MDLSALEDAIALLSDIPGQEPTMDALEKLYASLNYADVWLTNHAPEEDMKAAVEKVWTEFWKPIFERAKAGGPKLPTHAFSAAEFQQLKSELFDYHQMMRNTSAAFSELTGYQIAKPLTAASAVVGVASETQQRYLMEDILDTLMVAEDNADTGVEIEQVRWTRDFLFANFADAIPRD